jgi:hypothetical protein
MGLLRMVAAVLFVAAGLASAAAAAAQTPSIKGRQGPFRVPDARPDERPGDRHGRRSEGGSLVSFEGTAYVTLPAGNPFGLPPGRIGPAPFTATAGSGGPGVGQLDLKIMGMDCPGTVEHGQIQIGT